MRVAIYPGDGRPITIESIAESPLAPEDVRIAVKRCGICGSDVSLTSGSPFDYPAGCALGHEYAGEVIEIGRSVSTIRVGDRVTCIPKAGCGQCRACLVGHHFWCKTGPMVFGGFGDTLVAPESATFKLPASLSFADGALIEPMACGLHALNLAGGCAGKSILVLGAGSIGLSLIFWARRMSAARIVVLSRGAARRDIAITLGADAFVSVDDDDEVRMRTLPSSPDIVAECVGKSELLQQAIEHVRPGGTVLSMGMCVAADRIVPALAAFKEIKLLFPLAYSVGEFVETMRAFDADEIDPNLMIGEIIGLQELPQKLEAMRQGQGSLKVHVDPSMERDDARNERDDASCGDRANHA